MSSLSRKPNHSPSILGRAAAGVGRSVDAASLTSNGVGVTRERATAMKAGEYLQESVSRIKDGLRRVHFVSSLNAALKAHQLRAGLANLADEYARAAARIGFKYSEAAAIGSFRAGLRRMRPKYSPKRFGELNIFWVGANKDQDESGFLQALRRSGDVAVFYSKPDAYGQWFRNKAGRATLYDPAVVALNDASLMKQVEAVAARGSLDLVIGQMWANYLSVGALRSLRRFGAPVVNISMDDRLPLNWSTRRGVRLGAVGLLPAVDMVLTTTAETCTWYGVEGGAAIFWPLASAPEIFGESGAAERDIDVLFIGNRYGVREAIIGALQGRGIPVACYGNGWPNGPASATQSAALFRRAKIILGIGTVGHCDDVYTLKLRDFDAPMSGALYITHRNPDLVGLYTEGQEIDCYGSVDECAAKIKMYLANPELLNRVAAAGHRKALSRDTWRGRLETTFEALGISRKA